ncbi:hypothetical protein [Rhodopseudomonas sp.]|uniref:hypothetical protein n=1 Tax=Rhodopseudomonas sp. TaxID=1078 RepID=UPI003B3B34B1
MAFGFGRRGLRGAGFMVRQLVHQGLVITVLMVIVPVITMIVIAVLVIRVVVARVVMVVAVLGNEVVRLLGRGFDDLALHALAIAAAAVAAMSRAPAAGALLALFLGFAMSAFVGLDQRLTVGDRDLVVIGMDFAEGEEAVAVATVFDEGRLQRGFDPGDFGEVDVAAQLFALGGLEIKLFDAVAADHDHPGLFRVGGVDQHLVRHFSTHGGGKRARRPAQWARPDNATVHLIRG